MLFFVTTSPCREWVICAPAAFLGCGSRFACSLSGIEPRFPVTRSNHGRHLTDRRQLIGRTLGGPVAGRGSPCDRPVSYPESPKRSAPTFGPDRTNREGTNGTGGRESRIGLSLICSAATQDGRRGCQRARRGDHDATTDRGLCHMY